MTWAEKTVGAPWHPVPGSQTPQVFGTATPVLRQAVTTAEVNTCGHHHTLHIIVTLTGHQAHPQPVMAARVCKREREHAPH